MKESDNIKIKYLDGILYQDVILAGCNEIISHERGLNKINVFPIPDKDTGLNLRKTFAPLLEKFPVLLTPAAKASQEIARIAVASALGYSGIIFAQFIHGLAEKLNNIDKISPKVLAQASTQAVTRAYESIEDPQEGTVLTVMKEWSEEIIRLTQKIDDFAVLFRESLKRAVSSLEDTPNKLEILRKHNVVDAGGKAFVHFLEGIISFFEKGEFLCESPDKRKIPPFLEEKEEKDVENRFCAECCVRKENLDRTGLIKELNLLGHKLIFYGSLNFAKIHINTDEPEDVFSCAAQYGDVSAKKIFKFSPDTPDSEKKSIALVPDTTCDIADQYIEENDIYFIPVKVHAMDRVFTDKVDIIPEEFYKILDSSPTHPKTSQPSYMDFTEVYEHLLYHYRSIISVQLSRRLSGTFQTAYQAANNVAPDKITVLDGRNISVGMGLIVIEGIKALKEGLDCEAVVERIKNAVEEVEIFIGIPTLKYLVRGGRVAKAKGFIANILNINPILSVNREGLLEPIGKTRGRKKLEQKVFELASEKIRKEKEAVFSVAVAHTNAPQLGKKAADRIEEELKTEVTMVMNVSPALGVHGGPGVIGIGVLKTSK